MASPPKSVRERIEDWLGAWTRGVIRARWACIALMFALSAGLATKIPDLQIQTSTEEFLFEGDPVRAAYDEFRAQFGQEQIVMVTIAPPEVFDFAFLDELRLLHDELEAEVPYLEDITSLVNARSVYGRGDELVVEDLLENLERTPEALAALRERVLATPSYRDSGLISGDGRRTAILVEVATYSSLGVDGDDEFGGFDDEAVPSDVGTEKRAFLTGAENSALVEKIKEIVRRHESPDFPVLLGGGTMITHELSIAMQRDIPRFFGGALAAIAIFLIVLFRRFSPVVLSVLVVVPAVLATFGIAAVLGVPFAVTSQLLPSFFLAVGVSYTVHLVTIFLRELGQGEPRELALESAMRHSGLPIAMTALTTAVGMCSFLVAEMRPIATMGGMAALGVVVMFGYALVLLPALLAVLPLRARRHVGSPRIDALLGAAAAASARRPITMIVATALLATGAVASWSLLQLSSDPIGWFPDEHPFSQAADTLSEHFGGSSSLEVLVDTGVENGLHEPATLARLERLEELVERYKQQGSQLSYTISVADIARETHQALNANDPAYYRLPEERKLLAQELLLFENSGSDDLEKVVDPQFSTARFSIRSLWRNGVDTSAFIAGAEDELRATLDGVAEVELTGMMSVISRTVDATMESMLKSYALALALITPLMIFLIGSLRAGLVSMVPNLVPIFMTLGMMGLTGIPIDMFTLLAGCIAIGLAVDDTIHFITGFRRYLAQGNDPVRAVELTMQSTGRALLFTSVVLTSGFLVLTLSDMLNLFQVGVLTSFAIASAFILDITVTPALLVLTHRRKYGAASA